MRKNQSIIIKKLFMNSQIKTTSSIKSKHNDPNHVMISKSILHHKLSLNSQQGNESIGRYSIVVFKAQFGIHYIFPKGLKFNGGMMWPQQLHISIFRFHYLKVLMYEYKIHFKEPSCQPNLHKLRANLIYFFIIFYIFLFYIYMHVNLRIEKEF